MEESSRPFHIAVLASGTGTNAREIIRYFGKDERAQVVLVLTDKSDAGVIDIAARHQVPCEVIGKDDLRMPEQLLALLASRKTDLIVLAGFLRKVPEQVVKTYEGRILNLHPALLPKFGGQGMYGLHVHEAVIKADEKESGITIHQVNEEYDKGAPVFQARCPVYPGDEPSDLQQRVRALEHEHYPRVIGEYLDKIAAHG